MPTSADSTPHLEIAPASSQSLPPVLGASPNAVRKRGGGTTQVFDFGKIRSAVQKAADEVKFDMSASMDAVLADVVEVLPGDVVNVETVQDAVELALMRARCFPVAKAYILYRDKHAKLRSARRSPDPAAIGNYVHFSKYARYQPDLLRRETYLETTQRVRQMHLRKFADKSEVVELINWAFDRVDEKRVLPSMRSMQFGGPAVENNHNRLYNCSFSLIDRPRVFAEAMFLLLSGCGVGYSVQYDHVDKLPSLVRIDPKRVVHHVVGDTIEGWADAVYALASSYFDTGEYVEFSYHLVRKAGSPLKTSGGRAPGHTKLKESLEAMRTVFDGAQGRKLRPIECHDVMCHLADAVLSGGIRRSAMICLFSPEDSEMMYAKTGDWHPRASWRENANNSVALLRTEAKKKQFIRIFEMTKQWGEPGFFFLDDLDHGTNPCAEIGLDPVLRVGGTKLTGWALCNLTEINGAQCKTLLDFSIAARAAAIIGTLQASYTSMPYLGKVSEEIARRDALLGVSMTGMMDCPEVTCDPGAQSAMAGLIKYTNAEVAKLLGINTAARNTCVKPAGTTSMQLGMTGSGHHAHHARRYVRRITADELEVVFQAFKAKNPHMCVQKPNGKWAVEFPVEAPVGAIIKSDIRAIQFLEMVKSTQMNWVLPGTARTGDSPGLNHNVSNTVTVRPEEWDSVAEYLWENRKYFTGVALLASSGDKDYSFAPFEAVVTEADEAHWNHLIANYTPVEYAEIYEYEDGTALSAEAACAGGACLV